MKNSKNNKKDNYEKYNWDLEAILENDSLDNLYQSWLKTMNLIIEKYPHFIDNIDNFKEWTKINEKMRIISNRLMNYISNHAQEDVSDPQWIAWQQKLSIEGNKLTVALSDYENIVLENENKIKEFLKDETLKEYTRSFDNLFKTRPHILSKQEELLLAKLSKSEGGVEEMYDTLITSDIKFKDAINNKNKKVKIKTQADVFINLKSHDRNLRKTSWLSFHEAFYELRNTLTHALYYNYLTLNTDAQVRNFKDYIDVCCFNDEIDRSLILHVYEQVKDYKKIQHEFAVHHHSLLKQVLKLKEIEPWDASVDIAKKVVKVNIEQAKKIVLEALKPMGEEYLKIVNQAFNEKWISWLPKENKHTGAYSIGGTKGLSKYYILMNFDNTLGSVYTIIHELGHSLNSYYYSQAQKLYCSTSIFTAEIASITNEMLLNYYLLNKYKNNSQMKVMILDEMISGFFATTTRQVIFSNFEYIINEKINHNEAITYETIEQVYNQVQEMYLQIKDKKKIWKEPYRKSLITPLRISHFFVGNFYVYKYAIGQVVACIVASRIYHAKPNAIENYMKFLKSGTSLSPLDTIKLLDIDLTKKEPWIEAKEIMQEFIKEFKKCKTI